MEGGLDVGVISLLLRPGRSPGRVYVGVLTSDEFSWEPALLTPALVRSHLVGGASRLAPLWEFGAIVHVSLVDQVFGTRWVRSWGSLLISRKLH